MLTKQTLAGLIQLLQSISQDAVRLLFIKHLNWDPSPFTTNNLLDIVASSPPDAMAGLLVELISDSTAIRADAPT